jgi:hypothetical protein
LSYLLGLFANNTLPIFIASASGHLLSEYVRVNPRSITQLAFYNWIGQFLALGLASSMCLVVAPFLAIGLAALFGLTGAVTPLLADLGDLNVRLFA